MFWHSSLTSTCAETSLVVCLHAKKLHLLFCLVAEQICPWTPDCSEKGVLQTIAQGSALQIRPSDSNTFGSELSLNHVVDFEPLWV